MSGDEMEERGVGGVDGRDDRIRGPHVPHIGSPYLDDRPANGERARFDGGDFVGDQKREHLRGVTWLGGILVWRLASRVGKSEQQQVTVRAESPDV